MSMMRCRNCGHSSDAHATSPTNPHGDCVSCGCTRLTLPDPAVREARKREWLATCEFLTLKRGWVKTPELRVKAMGHGGALLLAVREGKRAVLAPRARVAQIRVTLTPIRSSRSRRGTEPALQ